MVVEDRVRWDGYFRQTSHQPYPPPDTLLLTFTPPPAAGATALDLAAGLGQNGLWLAKQGYLVNIMDISRVALKRAYAEMVANNLRNVNLLQTDIDTLLLEPAQYDVICLFRYLKRRLFIALKKATKPGGRIIYESFNTRYLELVPGFNEAFLLKVGELPTYFADWHILHYEEPDHNTRLVAVKPD